MSEHRVIGYAAAMSKSRFFAQSGALLVMGDEDILRACIVSRYRSRSILLKYRFRKIRYWELELWLNNGTALAMDETSYNRFAEAAKERGRQLKFESFPEELKENAHGVPVVRIRPRVRV